MPKMKWMKPKKPQLHVVSLSGGKDSTAMLLRMVEEGMRIDLIIFCDTGLEFPAMYRHLEKLERDIGMKVDVNVIGTGSVLRTAAIFFYLSNEGVSLLENAAHLGLPVPGAIKEVLEQLHERAEHGGNDDEQSK